MPNYLAHRSTTLRARRCVRLLRTFLTTGLVWLALTPSQAAAQFIAPDQVWLPAIGEDYVVEVSGHRWYPSSNVLLSGGEFEALGTPLDLTTPFGTREREWFSDWRVVIRPATRHKINLQYTLLTYRGRLSLLHDLAFDGRVTRAGQPTASELDVHMARIGYEYDFVSRDLGYVGVMLDARVLDGDFYVDVPLGPELADPRGAFGTIGMVGRGYLGRHVSVSGEVSLTPFSRVVLEGIDHRYEAAFVDIDAYATFNFSHWFGVQVGYRHVDFDYKFKSDYGDVGVNGPYIGAALRY